MTTSPSEVDAPKVITTSKGDEILVSAVDHAWLSQFSWSIGGHGYAQRFLPRAGTASAACVLMHRELLGLAAGDGRIGDHINGDKLDNRRANLRVVTPSQSSSNVAARGISQSRGVYPTRSGRWIARGKRDGQIVHLGTFDTVEEAAVIAHEWRLAHLPGYVDRTELSA